MLIHIFATHQLSPFLLHLRFDFHGWKVYPYLRWREQFRDLFSREKWPHNPLLKFSVLTKVVQIASVNAPIYYCKTHYLANSLCNSSRLIYHMFEQTLIVESMKENFNLPPPLLAMALLADQSYSVVLMAFLVM